MEQLFEFDPDEMTRIRRISMIPWWIVLGILVLLEILAWVLDWDMFIKVFIPFIMFFPLVPMVVTTAFAKTTRPVRTILIREDEIIVNDEHYAMNKDTYHIFTIIKNNERKSGIYTRQLDVKSSSGKLITRYMICSYADKESMPKLRDLTEALEYANQKALERFAQERARLSCEGHGGDTVIDFPVGSVWGLFIFLIGASLVATVLGIVMYGYEHDFRAIAVSALGFVLFVYVVVDACMNLPKLTRKIVVNEEMIEVNGDVYRFDEISGIEPVVISRFNNGTFLVIRSRGTEHKYFMGHNIDDKCKEARQILISAVKEGPFEN